MALLLSTGDAMFFQSPAERVVVHAEHGGGFHPFTATVGERLLKNPGFKGILKFDGDAAQHKNTLIRIASQYILIGGQRYFYTVKATIVNLATGGKTC